MRIRSHGPWRRPAWCLSGMAGWRRLGRADEARAHRPRLGSPPRQRACGVRRESYTTDYYPERRDGRRVRSSPAMMRRQDHPSTAPLIGGRGERRLGRLVRSCRNHGRGLGMSKPGARRRHCLCPLGSTRDRLTGGSRVRPPRSGLTATAAAGSWGTPPIVDGCSRCRSTGTASPVDTSRSG
jgi:hypothetical protein